MKQSARFSFVLVPQRLVEIAIDVPSGDAAPIYAGLIREKHARHLAIRLAGDLLTRAHDQDDLLTVIQDTRVALDDIEQHACPPQRTTTLLEGFVDPALRPLPVAPTGLGFVDVAMTGGGLVLGWMYLFVGPPKISKSAFLQFICLTLLHINPTRRVLWCRGEMSQQTLQTRALMMLSGLPSLILERQDDQLSADQRRDKAHGFEQLQDIASRFHVLPGPFDCASIDAAIEFTGADVAVVDYLQKVTPTDSTAQRREQVDAISQRLSQIAVERQVALLVVSNMSGSAASGKPSMATAFKESSGVAYDADAGYLAVLDEETAKLLNDGQELPDKYQVTWRCLGHRHGPQNPIRCTFDRYTLRFFGVAREGAA